MTYHVTAIYQDAEISYGEGDTFAWACEECAAGIDGFYASLPVNAFDLIIVNGAFNHRVNARTMHQFVQAYENC